MLCYLINETACARSGSVMTLYDDCIVHNSSNSYIRKLLNDIFMQFPFLHACMQFCVVFSP